MQSAYVYAVLFYDDVDEFFRYADDLYDLFFADEALYTRVSECERFHFVFRCRSREKNFVTYFAVDLKYDLYFVLYECAFFVCRPCAFGGRAYHDRKIRRRKLVDGTRIRYPR